MTIRDLRLAYGLTQQRMADILSIPVRTIEDWDGGRRKPADYVVDLIQFKLSKLLGKK